MESKAIEIDSLQKAFGDVRALHDISLAVREGEVYGLIGPQGAGKSTLVHLILGLMRPSGGWIEVLGTEDLERARSRIGFLPERARYHTRYSAREYLRFLGGFDGLSGGPLRDRIDVVLDRVGLADVAGQQLATFSRGMLQRLGIAQALLTDPPLLLLDEPFSGLDPAAQLEMLALIHDLRADHRTVFLVTTYFPDLERVCDRIGILVGGRLAAEADSRHLRQPASSVRIAVERLSPTLINQLRQFGSAVVCTEREILLRPNTPRLQSQIIRALVDADAFITSLVPQERPLERFYVQAIRGEPVDLPEVAEVENGVDHSIYARPVEDAAVGTSVRANAVSEQEVEPPPVAPPVVPPLQQGPLAQQQAPRSGEGDTLLRELLRRDRGRDESSL